METVMLALNAMNTRFELVLHGADPVDLRAAGEEALGEVQRIEGVLSAFQATSEIADVNARAAQEAVRVSPEVFALFLRARELWELTEGAFDITVGPLMRCWRFWGGSGELPEPAAIDAALRKVGMDQVELDSKHRTVHFPRESMTVDPGAIGKGYAIGQAVEILEENGVKSGLLHGGTSTCYAIGSPPGQSEWRVAMEVPDGVRASLPEMAIRDESLSVSSAAQKSFTANGISYGHVLDPRTGWPVERAFLSLVSTVDATEADALSTALMVSGAAGLEHLRGLRPDLRALVAGVDGKVSTLGMEASSRRGE